MAAVRKGTCDEPGKVTDLSDIRSPTDVMVITSLPYNRSPSARRSSQPPTANRQPL